MSTDVAKQRLIVECLGGLGNQLFQYAAGLFFAQRTGRALEVLSPLEPHVVGREFPFPFQLGEYTLEETIREPATVDRAFLPLGRRKRFLVQELEPFTRVRRVMEPLGYRFWPGALDEVTAPTVYLSGFWQAAGYVQHVETRLRREFRLHAPVHERNRAYAEQIGRLTKPVAVHVRLGDYETISHANAGDRGKTSMLLPASYYRTAMQAMRSLHPEASFVMFSNDPDKARRLLGTKQVALWVEGNGIYAAQEELWLMSCCQHHIIANSTYSWWGAWLNASIAKTVMAPRYWENTPYTFYPDLFPPAWTLINNLAQA